jgi:hypothetical protein
VKQTARFDYTTVGHVTVDVMSDGSRRPGGSAFYSGLQAARLGQRTLIITRGSPREVRRLLEPYRTELELEILPAQHTTTLQTWRSGDRRRQKVLAWAGPIPEPIDVDTSILHLAPVARETPERWRGSVGFVALTPQGLVRDWSGPDAEMSRAPLAAGDPAHAARSPRCDALVVSEQEREDCADLIGRTTTGGGIVAVTAGTGPTTLLMSDGDVVEVKVATVVNPTDDIGAGDVFAAAFFVELAHGAPAHTAAAFANAAASIRVSGAGPDSIGDRRAIESRLLAPGGPPAPGR